MEGLIISTSIPVRSSWYASAITSQAVSLKTTPSREPLKNTAAAGDPMHVENQVVVSRCFLLVRAYTSRASVVFADKAKIGREPSCLTLVSKGVDLVFMVHTI